MSSVTFLISLFILILIAVIAIMVINTVFEKRKKAIYLSNFQKQYNEISSTIAQLQEFTNNITDVVNLKSEQFQDEFNVLISINEELSYQLDAINHFDINTPESAFKDINEVLTSIECALNTIHLKVSI